MSDNFDFFDENDEILEEGANIETLKKYIQVKKEYKKIVSEVEDLVKEGRYELAVKHIDAASKIIVDLKNDIRNLKSDVGSVIFGAIVSFLINVGKSIDVLGAAIDAGKSLAKNDFNFKKAEVSIKPSILGIIIETVKDLQEIITNFKISRYDTTANKMNAYKNKMLNAVSAYVNALNDAKDTLKHQAKLKKSVERKMANMSENMVGFNELYMVAAHYDKQKSYVDESVESDMDNRSTAREALRKNDTDEAKRAAKNISDKVKRETIKNEIKRKEQAAKAKEEQTNDQNNA